MVREDVTAARRDIRATNPGARKALAGAALMAGRLLLIIP